MSGECALRASSVVLKLLNLERYALPVNERLKPTREQHLRLMSLAGAATSILSRQKFCRDRHIFVATDVCHDKTLFLSKQKYAFVVTKLCLSRQIFVVTNMFLNLIVVMSDS